MCGKCPVKHVIIAFVHILLTCVQRISDFATLIVNYAMDYIFTSDRYCRLHIYGWKIDCADDIRIVVDNVQAVKHILSRLGDEMSQYGMYLNRAIIRCSYRMDRSMCWPVYLFGSIWDACILGLTRKLWFKIMGRLRRKQRVWNRNDMRMNDENEALQLIWKPIR